MGLLSWHPKIKVNLLLLLVGGLLYAQVVLIDPGHGGSDCGAKAKIWQDKELKLFCEKDLALEIAQLVKEELGRFPYIKTYLTRSFDRTLTLENRAEMADKIRADIFISIHLNAATSTRPGGFETYYLDNHANVAVKKIEEIENREASGEEKIVNQILADLVIEKTAPQSKKLGELVHKEISGTIEKSFSLVDRGLRPALFFVLALSKRPSVLLEAGFISNSEEFNKIKSREFQKIYAKAVAEGVVKYFGKPKEKINLF